MGGRRFTCLPDKKFTSTGQACVLCLIDGDSEEKTQKLTWTFAAVWMSVIIAVWLLLIGLPDAILQVCSLCQPHMVHGTGGTNGIYRHNTQCEFTCHCHAHFSTTRFQTDLFSTTSLSAKLVYIIQELVVFSLFGLSHISFEFLFLVHEPWLKSCTSRHVKIASKNCTWDWRYVQSCYKCGQVVFIVRQLLCVYAVRIQPVGVKIRSQVFVTVFIVRPSLGHVIKTAHIYLYHSALSSLRSVFCSRLSSYDNKYTMVT